MTTGKTVTTRTVFATDAVAKLLYDALPPEQRLPDAKLVCTASERGIELIQLQRDAR